MLPTFATDRLILRERTINDLESCLLMDRDPEVVQYIDGPWNSPEKHKNFVIERISHRYPDGLGYWTIEAKKDHRFLGWILLIPIDLTSSNIEIGWRLIRDAWGRGYATEAAKVILHHAVNTVGIKKLYADIHPENIGSMKVAEKLGFIDKGLMKNEDGSFYRYIYER